MAKRITTAQLLAVTPEPGKSSTKVHAGAPGLYLVVRRGKKGGLRRSWIYRWMEGRKSTDRGLGSFEHVTLPEARALAAKFFLAQRLPGSGETMPEARSVPTFEACSRKAFEANSKTWTAATVTAWRGILTNYLQPLMSRRVDQIDGEAVLSVLKPVYNEKPAMARKVRNALRLTLGWAEAHGYADRNYAGEAIDGGLPKTAAVKEHRKALPPAEVGAVLDRLDATSAPPNVKACIRLIAFCGVRSGEARAARVEEFELDGPPVWTVPADRMKQGKAHRVPLSVEAVRIVQAQIEAVGGEGLLFPSSTGAPLSNSVAIRAWRRVTDADIHGLRASLRSWAAEKGYRREVAESCLAHQIGDNAVEASYTHATDLCEQRRELMNDWAGYLIAG